MAVAAERAVPTGKERDRLDTLPLAREARPQARVVRELRLATDDHLVRARALAMVSLKTPANAATHYAEVLAARGAAGAAIARG